MIVYIRTTIDTDRHSATSSERSVINSFTNSICTCICGKSQLNGQLRRILHVLAVNELLNTLA